jgi:hypothetical protein
VLLNRPHVARTETVNDADRYLANFWRAVQADPGSVARAADWPINEADLEARHHWLITEGRSRLVSLMATADEYDAQVAGWWCWGQCAWIGSGWCSGEGPWVVTPEGWSNLRNAGKGVNRKLPHLGDGGKGHPHRDHLITYFGRLAARLRYTRVACGDWRRVLTPSVTFRHGTTGIVLDPPYGEGEVDYSAGGNRTDIADDVRRWAIANGDNPDLRIALCSYGGAGCPAGWREGTWVAAGGYGSTAKGETQAKLNRKRETVYFSPHCLNPAANLFFNQECPRT